MVYTNRAFEAAAAFEHSEKSRRPVLVAQYLQSLQYQGEPHAGHHQTANKLIADIWFARADFAKDHPGIIEALVRGIFDAMDH